MVYEIWCFKNFQLKIQESLSLIAEWMQRLFDHIFAYHNSLIPIGSDEIPKRLQMCWIIPNEDIKKGGNFQFFDEITIKESPPICPLSMYFIWRPLIGPQVTWSVAGHSLGNPLQLYLALLIASYDMLQCHVAMFFGEPNLIFKFNID